MQLLNMNPNVRNMMESNTQMREMIQNPEFLRQLTSPETLQVINHTALATCASKLLNVISFAAINFIPAVFDVTTWPTTSWTVSISTFDFTFFL
jgi:hypothetical protein